MAALRDVKVSMEFDFSVDMNGRRYTPEVLKKMEEDFKNSSRVIPIATTVAGHRFELGKVENIEADGMIVKVDGKINNGGSFETATCENEDGVSVIQDMRVLSFSLVGGFPLDFGEREM